MTEQDDGLVDGYPFIPYVQDHAIPEGVRSLLVPYAQRMGFVPNALRIYMHRPEIARPLWELQHEVLRGPSSTLDRFLKRKLSLVASATNGCAYCTAHHCSMLRKPVSEGPGLGGAPGDEEGWGLSEVEVQAIVAGTAPPKSELEDLCFQYVRAASSDPTTVSEELLRRLGRVLSPPQIVELACVVGFWKFYNAVHDSLHIPVEGVLDAQHDLVELSVATAKARRAANPD